MPGSNWNSKGILVYLEETCADHERKCTIHDCPIDRKLHEGNNKCFCCHLDANLPVGEGKKKTFWRVNCLVHHWSNSVHVPPASSLMEAVGGRLGRAAGREQAVGGGGSGGVTCYSAAHWPWQWSRSQQLGYLPLIISLSLTVCFSVWLSLPKHCPPPIHTHTHTHSLLVARHVC